MSLSIAVHKPAWQNAEFIEDLYDEIESYSHTILALGGFESASFSANVNRAAALDWIANGLGRHLEVYGQNGEEAWEGFANEVVVSIGPLSVVVGPLLNIVNKASFTFQDFTTNQPSAIPTSYNLDSQGRYGIHHKLISLGKVSETTANKISQVYLTERAWPNSSQTFGQSDALTIQINCMGYYHFFQQYPYSDLRDLTYPLRQKIIDVVGRSPNSFVAAAAYVSYATFASNTLSVLATETNDKYAWDLIKEMVGMGPDDGNERMLFGMYEHGHLRYNKAPETVEYFQNLSDNGVRVADLNGREVKPWAIRPGKWLEFTDLEVPEGSFGLLGNPKYMFVESVTFSTPYNISMTGGRTDRLPQQLAKLGLGSI